MLEEFPRELFFDDDLIWHRQQFGRPGQVATASLVLDGETVYSITHVSDLVQRIALRREHKTRVEKVFGGWRHMLLNAVLAFAQAQGARRVLTPTATLALHHTDRSRRPGAGLFERIYDRTVTDLFAARRDGEWWVLDVADCREPVVPERRTEDHRPIKTICICHDIERGLGHLDADPAFARRAERTLAARSGGDAADRSGGRGEGDLLRGRLAAFGGSGMPRGMMGTHSRSIRSTTGSRSRTSCSAAGRSTTGSRAIGRRARSSRRSSATATCSSTTSSGWRAPRGPLAPILRRCGPA